MVCLPLRNPMWYFQNRTPSTLCCTRRSAIVLLAHTGFVCSVALFRDDGMGGGGGGGADGAWIKAFCFWRSALSFPLQLKGKIVRWEKQFESSGAHSCSRSAGRASAATTVSPGDDLLLPALMSPCVNVAASSLLRWSRGSADCLLLRGKKDRCDERERGCALFNGVCLTRTHSLTGCIDGESDGGGGGGGGRDGKHTVAGSPTNQKRDEGMWAWLAERQCRAGEFHSPSLTWLEPR